MTTAHWSFSTGVRGRNRVRAFEGRSGILFVEFWERTDPRSPLKRVRQSLGHRDHRKAERQAKAIAARLAAGDELAAGEITLGSLFDIYVAEVTSQKSEGKQAHDLGASRMFLQLWGRDRAALSLNLYDWNEFIRLRREGHIGPGKKTQRVRDRQVEYDLCWLRSVYRWGNRAGPDGYPLLSRNPIQGFPIPRERNPIRPVMTEDQYRALVSAARTFDWRLELALILANATGHRISAIRQLRWSDIDLQTGTIRWRAEHDKIAFEHETPISADVSSALVTARRRAGSIGDAWVIPSERRPELPSPRGTLGKAFALAAQKAGIRLPSRARWHSFRRKFATEMKDLPLKDLTYLGGWKNTRTILECYQQPDQERLREALQHRRPFGLSVVSTQAVSIDTLANRMA